jgi:hypothetical protein
VLCEGRLFSTNFSHRCIARPATLSADPRSIEIKSSIALMNMIFLCNEEFFSREKPMYYHDIQKNVLPFISEIAVHAR